MLLIIQIALGIVLGVILLSLLPYIVSGAYVAVKNTMVGIGIAITVVIGTLLLYGAFYVGWHVSVVYIPKPVLAAATLTSVVSLLLLAWIAINNKLPVPGKIWFLGCVLLGLAVLAFMAAIENYKEWGELGNELNYIAPFYVFFAVLGWSALRLFKLEVLGMQKNHNKLSQSDLRSGAFFGVAATLPQRIIKGSVTNENRLYC